MSPQWVEEQCRRFDAVLALFTAEMRAEFRRKAEEGRQGWEDPQNCHGLWTDMLSHAVHKNRAAGQEAHCANFLAFLYMHRTEQLGTVLYAAPAERVVGGTDD